MPLKKEVAQNIVYHQENDRVKEIEI